MPTNLGFRPPVIEIAGDVYPRGGSLSFEVDASFSGAFVVNAFVRGGGQGAGGDADGTGTSAPRFERGEYGTNGDYDQSVVALVGDITVAIGARSMRGEDSEFVSGTGATGGAADGAGDTSVSADGVTLSVSGGSANGRGAVVTINNPPGDSDWQTAPFALSPANPLGGLFGRGGGYSGFPIGSNNGVVQIVEVID
tara:strand:- start:10192 stop:10779 length:588 start_codon:yes stop_codon:yes gene_type:complete